MSAMKDPFEVLFVHEEGDRAAAAVCSGVAESPATQSGALPGAAIARLRGFDLDDCPLIADLRDLPGEIVAARSTVSLLRSHIGSDVVVLFERGDVRRPIVVGVLGEQHLATEPPSESPARCVSVQADDDHLVLSAERQITLRCGDASVTLTRAGKVIIKGTYVVSRSGGCNKIKGAAVDIN